MSQQILKVSPFNVWASTLGALAFFRFFICQKAKIMSGLKIKLVTKEVIPVCVADSSKTMKKLTTQF